MGLSFKRIHCRTIHILDGLVNRFVSVVPVGMGLGKVLARILASVTCLVILYNIVWCYCLHFNIL